jgi:four helix bundle protein
MSAQPPAHRRFDLEERTSLFAVQVRDFLETIPNTDSNRIYKQQLLRSSSSIGANYIEANDAIGKRDFAMKIKTSRRESKESAFWIRLIRVQPDESSQATAARLLDEARQFVRIFSAIIARVSTPDH